MNPAVFLNALNATIAELKYGEKPVELYEPIQYLMDLSGKRIRPLMALLAYNLFDDQWQNAVKPALAVEVFHNFTLMHDDIMDKAPLRRGKPTVHEKWNENIAILSGDVMLVQAYELLLEVSPEKLKLVMSRFNKTAAEVCEGQQFDMNFELKETVTEEDYIEMIRLKTSVLLGFSLELGAIIANASLENSRILYDIGVNIGLGFQLKDDLLDVYGDPEKFGKQIGGDIIANKKTFMLIEAQLKADSLTQQKLNDWLNKKEFNSSEKVKAVTEIFDQLEIRQIAENKINFYFDKALASLKQLEANESKKQELEHFILKLIDREA
ncbi:MAG: polyprenyl synthetase family protein [Pseudarcicella sp.]|nr:polyprenyl synthetase family protein [Pseudarcicella sp.]MBP6410107.1 polyprenyl synthetase family protein [Pseudarcicella sp.]